MKKTNTRGMTCYKCGRQEHYKKDFSLIKKIRSLEINKEKKQEWLNLLGTLDSESSSMDEESLSDNCENGCIGICDYNEINVITGTEKLFELITKVNDQEEQKEYLKKLKDMLETKIKNKLEAYSLNVILFKQPIVKKIPLEDLKDEVRILKEEVREIKEEMDLIKRTMKGKNIISSDELSSEEEDEGKINIITRVNYHKWYAYMTLVIKDFKITLRTLIDSGADHNCIREGLIPTKYFEKTKEQLKAANKQKLKVKYKLSRVHVCIGAVCFENTFLLVKTLPQDMILGTPFISQLYSFTATKNRLISKVYGKEIEIKFIEEMKYRKIDEVKQKNL